MKVRKTISIEQEKWDLICKVSDFYGISASNYISICCMDNILQNSLDEKMLEFELS